LWKERGGLWAELGRHDEAAANFDAYVDRLPKDEGFLSPRSLELIDLTGWKDAYQKLMERRSADKHLMICRGRDALLHGLWQEAAGDYRQVVRDRPISDEWFEAACTLLLTGDVKGYQELCRVLAERPGVGTDSAVSYFVVRCAAIAVPSGVEPAHLLAWARQAVTHDRPSWCLHALGLALYRAGEFDAAVKFLEESNAAAWDERAKAQNWLVLAMAHGRAGRPEPARQSLERARELMKQAAPAEAGGRARCLSPDWAGMQVLVIEAEAVLRGGTKRGN
jgi:tetratricopeptide (TPR) repeat protein